MAIDLKKFYDAAVEASTTKAAKAVEIQKLFDAGDTEKGLAMKTDLDTLTKKAKDAEEMYLSMRDAAQGEDPAKKFVPADDREKANKAKSSDILKSNEYTTAFFKAFASSMTPKDFKKSGVPEGMDVLMKALTETGGTPAGADGGFLLPTEFNNMIIERKRQLLDLSQYVNVENVQAFSGWRAVEKAAASTPFTTFANNSTVPASEQPAFEKITYQVSDYGGLLPVGNDLLEDTPVNIMTYLAKWFGKKVVLTNNSLILTILNALTTIPADTATPKNALDTVKHVLNVVLDPDISVNATIFVNQDGFDFLDQIKDGMNRPLLQPDPTNDTAYKIKGRPVALLSNRLLPSTTVDTKSHSRIIIGDAAEAITLFARSGLEMVSTNIGGGAFENNNTVVRGIMRADCKQTDDGAVASIDVTLN
ncbi:phage major capsid protein [Caproicibacterium sp. NSD3]